MDPLTQGIVGSIAGQQLAKPKQLLPATLLGALSGMAPDLDIFLRSDTDPLLALEFHRQFTHSLFFIPFGGFICALFFFFVFRPLIRRVDFTFLQVLLFCTLGYATHGLLDACTTYGTQLLWPFSDMRVAWNTISIIDPLFTLPLLGLVVSAVILRGSPVLARGLSLAALVWLVMYSLLGIVQRERAENAGWALAKSRGHEPSNLEAKPGFANIMVWKVVYTTDTYYYVDAIRTGLSTSVYPGERIARLDIARDFPWLINGTQQTKDVERFRWFSNGYLSVSTEFPNRIIDVRYSFIPNQIKGMWGIELDAEAAENSHINYVFDRRRDRQTATTLWDMIVGKAADK